MVLFDLSKPIELNIHSDNVNDILDVLIIVRTVVTVIQWAVPVILILVGSIDLVKAVCYLEGIELSENEIQVEFDYSRFENQEKIQLRLEREVSKGITSKVEYRMKVYGETEEIAKQKIDEIKKSEPSVKDLLGTNNEE